MTRITTCIFDAYGTLFDVSAAARALAATPGHEAFAATWEQVSADWRQKQLEYSWLRAIRGEGCDFWQVTEDGLDWALERAGLGEVGLRTALLGLYWRLPAYPEVPEILAQLNGAGLDCGILSNGTVQMLDAAIDSAGISDRLSGILSVELAGIFKPDRRVYNLVENHYGCARDEVLFVSSNGWDVSAAAQYGFHTLWVNRAGLPVDRMPGFPEHIGADLRAVPALLGI